MGTKIAEVRTPLGPLRSGSRLVRLKDITSKIGTGATPRGGESVYLPSRTNFALIRSQNVFDRNFDAEGLSFISDEHAAELRNAEVKANDLLLNITGDGVTFGRACMVLAGALPACVNQHVSIIRTIPNVCTPGYLLSYLTHPTIKKYIESFNAGGSRRAITKGHIESFEIPLPAIEEQRRIAHILGTLDDKIELNRRMNATLEAMARALFQSWFVDFDPVRAKAAGRKPAGVDPATAALFPSSFDDSELGKIPKGWRVDSIKNRASNIQYGFTQSATMEPIGPHFLRITDIRGGRVDWNSVPFCAATNAEGKKYRILDGDVFVARTGASTGENVYVIEPPPAVFASYLVRFQFKSSGIGRLVGEFMRGAEYQSYIGGILGGSAQPNASAQALANVSTVFPTDDVAMAFYNALRPLDLRRAANDRESRTLAALRDTLLPQLLSGEVSVEAAAISQTSSSSSSSSSVAVAVAAAGTPA